MNKNNLNRIKGILSAKNGTQVPKFQGGFVIYHKSTSQPLYSKDGTSWFTDEDYMSPFTGSLDEFTEPELGQQFYTKNSNVTIPNQPVDNNSKPKDFSLPNTSKLYNFIQNPLVGQGVENYYNYLKDNNQLESSNKPPFLDIIDQYNLNFEITGGIDTDPNGSVKAAAASNQQVQDKVQQTANDAAVEEQITETREQRQQRRQQERQDRRDERMANRQARIDARQERIEAKYGDTKLTPELAGQISQYGTTAMTAIGDAFGAKQMATDSDTTKTADQVYDGIAGAVEQMGPWGKVVGTAMKLGGAAGDMIQELGGGTDQQTKMDKWMDSSFFSWNIGMINGFAGKNTQSFGVDQETMEQVGSSYGGTATSINEAAESADKKYGLFSSKARKKADSAINKARQQQNLMGNIADQASDKRLAVQSMGEQAGLAYSMMTSGGYDQKYTYAAKEGGTLEWNPQIELKWEPLIELNWELPEFKEGGNINIVEELEWIPELQKGNKIRTLEELIEYAKKENPRFIQRMSEPLRFIRINFKDENGNTSWAHATHEMNYKGKDVFSMIQEIDGKLHRFDSEEEAYENAKKTNNILTFDSEEEAKLFAKSGQNENGEYYGYKLGWQDFFNTSPEGLKEEYSINQYKQGGSVKESDVPEIEETNQKNVIPEGALHKNKHHMEHAEGLTKKGIPVIDEEGEQQAEIEHSEIIFTLEVTKKLEEYYQIFYSEESTNKEKEQAALDTGKLLVYQILENTEDRTGLIESCKQGGTLILKKSTDDLIEEALEWIPNITIIEEIIEEKPKKESKKSEKEQMKEAIKEVLIELLTK